MERQLGPVLVAGGVALVLLGVLLWSGTASSLFSWFGSWFGRLPGDIRIDRDGTRVFLPFTSTLVVSAVLTVALNVIRRLLR